MVMKESKLEHRVVSELRQRGAWCSKFVSPTRCGVPDQIVVIPGHGPIFIEFKSVHGALSTGQARVHEAIRDSGGEVFTIRSYDEFLTDILPLFPEE